MSWQTLQFKDLISETGVFNDGDWVESKDQDPEGEVRLIQLADIGVGKFIDKSARYLTKEKAIQLNCTFLKPGDILIARMPDPIGRACIFPVLERECVTVVDVCVVRPNSERAHDKWLMHMVNSRMFNNQILNFVTGTTRQRISRGNLAKLDVKLPPLDEQKRIAAILDKADAIRQKRKQAIVLADDFLRSVFLDMFGDIDGNDWGLTTVEKLAQDKKGSMRTGPFGSQLLHSEFTDSGIAVLGIDNAVNNKFEWSKSRFISEYKYKELHRYTVYPGDVIITIMGTCGRCAVVPNDIPVAINTKHLCCITLDQEKCLPSFLHAYFLYHPEAKRYLAQNTKGAIMAGLNMGIIKGMPVPEVPITLQERFEDLLRYFEKTSARLGKGLVKTETNFISLSQKAFSGQL
ncbi:restriction endonuclease subunit S [Enterovibrio norvegicus]|uniref:restriction endonuclease subunit S n=1 Tax=Enterovibrio norvegicus TaxID=188144 RepID=UPI0013D67661|nr:restriction endonuclease subunit S [Enterovibrio norvegicus]